MAGKTDISLTHKEWQIVKHGLQKQIEYKKNHGPVTDIPAEEKLLNRVEEYIKGITYMLLTYKQ